MNRTVRNLCIFAAGSLGGGLVGIAVDRVNPPPDTMQGLGALVWLISPLLSAVLLRTFGGDGWKDFGLAPNLRAGWVWYLAAVLIVPVVGGLTVSLGMALGAIALAASAAPALNAFVPLFGVALASVLLKNLFEEFAWRGYLAPRFASLKFNSFVGYILTGLIWAGWHVPYYLYFLPAQVRESRTILSANALIVLAFVLLPLQAIVFGELRLLSKSVWPPFLMHCALNAVGLSLLARGLLTLNESWGSILSPGGEGIVFSLLMGLTGIGLYWIRRARTQTVLKQSDSGYSAVLSGGTER